MPVYEYTALDSRGKKRKGVLDADSMASARQKIRLDGVYPVEIKETVPRGRKGRRGVAAKGGLFSFHFTSRIKQQEIYMATRQLATLLGAGIPLVPSLNALIEQTGNSSLRTIITQIKDSVNEGNTLTSALSEHPRLFSKIYVNMVHAGEASGSLDVVLERLADVGERQQALRSRISAALIYPVFMALVGATVLFLLITFIVPSITKVFDDRNQLLPLPTTLLINFSHFLQSYWILVLLLIIALLVGIRAFIRKPKGREIWDRLKLTLPVLSDLNIKIAAATMGSTLSSLLRSGVPLVTALQIVKNIFNNIMLEAVMDEATEELEKGRTLSGVLRGNPYFTPMLVQMIAVGEQSGSLEKMLEKAANSYEKEVETKIMAMTSMIEPVMILLMGMAVSFIVISILLPIFEMNQLIK